MTHGLEYTIYAPWGPRAETPAQLAERVMRMLARFEALGSVYANWFYATKWLKKRPQDRDMEQLAVRIAQGIGDEDKGRVQPYCGYYYGLCNNCSDDWGPRNLGLSIHGGGLVPNSVDLQTDYDIVPDPDIVTYAFMKEAVLAISESFEVVGCRAYRNDLSNFWQKQRTALSFVPSWITYVPPAFAAQVVPPARAMIEHRPDGGLLMAATDETFVTTNPAHLAMAREIYAAVAPLNDLPLLSDPYGVRGEAS